MSKALNDLVRNELYVLTDKDKKFDNWMHIDVFREKYVMLDQNFAYYKSKYKYAFKTIDGFACVNSSELRKMSHRSYNDDINMLVDKMCESIYYELDKYIGDFHKAKLMAEFTGTKVGGWVSYFIDFRFPITSKTLSFVKYGRRLLTSPTLRTLKNEKSLWYKD